MKWSACAWMENRKELVVAGRNEAACTYVCCVDVNIGGQASVVARDIRVWSTRLNFVFWLFTWSSAGSDCGGKKFKWMPLYLSGYKFIFFLLYFCYNWLHVELVQEKRRLSNLFLLQLAARRRNIWINQLVVVDKTSVHMLYMFFHSEIDK